jgi:hypothetical protein
MGDVSSPGLLGDANVADRVRNGASFGPSSTLRSFVMI